MYEEIIETLEAKNDDTDSDPYETARIADTPETRQTANESLRSMYSSNRTADDSKIDDIMVIDVLGEQDVAPPQSTPVKKVNCFCPNLFIPQNNFAFMLQKVVVKRKKVDPEAPNETRKKSKTVVFQSVISTTKFSEVGGNEKSLKVTVIFLIDTSEESILNIY